MWDSLSKKGLPFSLINYFKYYYSTARTGFQLSGGIFKWICQSRGVKQGDPISPLFFNVVIERILNFLDSSVGVELELNTINHIAYADDVVLLARTTIGLQHLVDGFNAAARRANLLIYVEKSRTLSLQALG